jgi:hypothetical protein
MFTKGQKLKIEWDHDSEMTGTKLDSVAGCVVEIIERHEESDFWWIMLDGEKYLCHQLELKEIK